MYVRRLLQYSTENISTCRMKNCYREMTIRPSRYIFRINREIIQHIMNEPQEEGEKKSNQQLNLNAVDFSQHSLQRKMPITNIEWRGQLNLYITYKSTIFNSIQFRLCAVCRWVQNCKRELFLNHLFTNILAKNYVVLIRKRVRYSKNIFKQKILYHKRISFHLLLYL